MSTVRIDKPNDDIAIVTHSQETTFVQPCRNASLHAATVFVHNSPVHHVA